MIFNEIGDKGGSGEVLVETLFNHLYFTSSMTLLSQHSIEAESEHHQKFLLQLLSMRDSLFYYLEKDVVRLGDVLGYSKMQKNTIDCNEVTEE